MSPNPLTIFQVISKFGTTEKEVAGDKAHYRPVELPRRAASDILVNRAGQLGPGRLVVVSPSEAHITFLHTCKYASKLAVSMQFSSSYISLSVKFSCVNLSGSQLTVTHACVPPPVLNTASVICFTTFPWITFIFSTSSIL